jgi:hypothetical protein
MKKLVLVQDGPDGFKSYPFLSDGKKEAKEEIKETIMRERERTSCKWFEFHGAFLHFDSDYEILSLNEWFERFKG